jgi:hypothetical protein
MIERRTFLKSTLGALGALALGLPAARLFAAEPISGLAAGAVGEGLHLVDGWILTSADLRAIATHEI